MLLKLKKYFIPFILVSILLTSTLYLYPREVQIHSYVNIKKLKEEQFYFILIFHIIILITLFLKNIVHEIKEKKSSFLILTLSYIVYSICMFNLSQEAFLGVELYLNRQESLSEQTKQYKISYINKRENGYFIESLRLPNYKKSINVLIKIDSLTFHTLKKYKSIVEIKFQQGRFGINHSPTFVKEIEL
ncbi:conserved membrane hypothetical protein [Tenacibaculum sp. 190524A02b]|uniref:DUF2393 domain-containing protein n=1 Tax=Tenacibaculum vairaonense TaxID=3137860 RepID=A0ABP1F8U0_9FLAO